MNIVMRHVLLPALFAGCCLIGCSGSDTSASAAAAAQATSADADTDRTGDGPCGLLSDTEVHRVLGGSAPGKRDHSLDKYGIQSCIWETPTDRFVVQTLSLRSGTAEDELRGRVQGSIDPLMAGAGDRIRYETIAGVGEHAVMVVEKADPARGILADIAQLVAQRGDRLVVLFTGSSLAGGDRAAALATLEALGRSAVRRL